MNIMKNHTQLLSLTEGAVCVALAVALSFLRLDFWANGGSISLVMLPLMIYSIRRGGWWGIGAGLVFGILKCVVSGGIAYGWQSLILDYGVAYALTGLAGFFPSRPLLAVFIGSLARYICHVLSGVIIWGEWIEDLVIGSLTLRMHNALIYSLLYNGGYMLGSFLLTALIVVLIGRNTKLLRAD